MHSGLHEEKDAGDESSTLFSNKLKKETNRGLRTSDIFGEMEIYTSNESS